MAGGRGSSSSQSASTSDSERGSFKTNFFILAYLLLARNGNTLDVAPENPFEFEVAVASSDPLGLKKKKPVVKEVAGDGGSADGQESNSCLFPGLHDDMALECLAHTSRSEYFKLACLNKSFKSLIGSGYLYKLRRQMGIIQQWVYVACSLMPWEAFDPFSLRWMRLPTMPCDDCFNYADKESLAVGTDLLVFGRELSGFAIWMYSLVTHDWNRCPLMNLSRCLFASSSRGEFAIVAGGTDKNGNILKTVEKFNSELLHWEFLPKMNVARKLCAGFFMDGKFYVVGGMSGLHESLTCGEEFDLQTRTWRRIKDMYPRGNRATQSPPLVAVVNNELYAADESTNEVKKYDKETNTWSFVRRLPLRADSYNGWGLAFKACGDKLLVIGGRRSIAVEVIILHYWCPAEGADAEWRVLAARDHAGSFVYNCAIMGC